MKDPAFLFYYQDWLVGTYFLNRREKGAYMDLLCYQADKGELTLKSIKEILNGDFECWEKLKEKFIEENGVFYNKRLKIEKEKRALHSEHQRDKVNKRWNNDKYRGNTVVIPLLNENENEDGIDSSSSLSAIFEIFRTNYPGTKRGFKIEFENLKKKHKDWEQVIPILSDKLNYQLSCRAEKEIAGGFVPEWKNLQTWINQRCWEEEIATNNLSKTNGANKKLNGATDYEVAEIIARKFGVNAVAE